MKSRGNISVEFVLLLPAAFMLFFLTVQFTLYLIEGSVVQFASFAASRALEVHSEPHATIAPLFGYSDSLFTGINGDEAIAGLVKKPLFNLGQLEPLYILVSRAPVLKMPCVHFVHEDNPLMQGELCR